MFEFRPYHGQRSVGVSRHSFLFNYQSAGYPEEWNQITMTVLIKPTKIKASSDQQGVIDDEFTWLRFHQATVALRERIVVFITTRNGNFIMNIDSIRRKPSPKILGRYRKTGFFTVNRAPPIREIFDHMEWSELKTYKMRCKYTTS